MKTKPKMIYLEWEDANSMTAWTENKVVDAWLKTNHDAGEVRQVGWLIRETKTCLIVASRWAPENDYQDEQWGNLQKIPKTWIKKRVALSSERGVE